MTDPSPDAPEITEVDDETDFGPPPKDVQPDTEAGDEPLPEPSDNGVKDTDPEQDVDQEPTPSA